VAVRLKRSSASTPARYQASSILRECVMKNDKLIRLALTSAILAALSPFAWAGDKNTGNDQTTGNAAQQTPQQAPPSSNQRRPANQSQTQTQTLETVVVTATPTGVSKLDASYNIVAASREQIQKANPLSTADLLKISPGIWPESTGGQTGANI